MPLQKRSGVNLNACCTLPFQTFFTRASSSGTSIGAIAALLIVSDFWIAGWEFPAAMWGDQKRLVSLTRPVLRRTSN
jgi:hypothetical protein